LWHLPSNKSYYKSKKKSSKTGNTCADSIIKNFKIGKDFFSFKRESLMRYLAQENYKLDVNTSHTSDTSWGKKTPEVVVERRERTMVNP
jgi:hypothetical protein